MAKKIMINKEGHEVKAEPIDASELSKCGYWEKGTEQVKEVKSRGKRKSANATQTESDKTES